MTMYLYYLFFYNLWTLAIISQSVAKPVKHSSFHKFHPHHQHHLLQESQSETTHHVSAQEPMFETRLQSPSQSSDESNILINVSTDDGSSVDRTEDDGGI